MQNRTDSLVKTMIVLLVESDPTVRSVLRSGLEPTGIQVLVAENVAQARVLIDEPFEAAILDLCLPDGSVEELLPELRDRLPDSRIIIHSTGQPMDGLPHIQRYDIPALTRLLALDADGPQVVLQARRAVGRVHRAWIELCRWDPSLPFETRPPVAEAVIKAVTEALERPQPLGWGLDPALQPVANVFGLNVGDVRRAVAEMVCLKEAFIRVVIPACGDDQLEALHRLDMIIDRCVVALVESGVDRLANQAFTDELTGLGNRWAFEEDLDKEVSRSRRSNRPLTVAVVDVDRLKETNDTMGHPAGDELLRRTGQALRMAARRADRAYRIGGDEFALILVDSQGIDPDDLLDRLLRAGSAPISLGVASWPPDDLDDLVRVADDRLYERRRSLLGRSRGRAR